MKNVNTKRCNTKRFGITPILKRGDNQGCSDYRGITLLSIVAKLYESVLHNKIKRNMELDEAQYGFRKERSIQELIFFTK